MTLLLPTYESVADALDQLGWLDSDESAPLDNALQRFQDFFGLTGPADPFRSDVQALLNLPRFCTTGDHFTAEARPPQWPSKVAADLRFWVSHSFPGRTLEQTWAALEVGFRWWAQVCGIVPRRGSTKQGSHIYLVRAAIDGRGKVLGDAQLPVSPSRGWQSRIRADSGEFWAVEQPRRGFIFAPLFLVHEVGHSLGIHHHRGRGVGVMDAVYDERYLTNGGNPLTEADAAEGQRRYGPPTGEVDPPSAELVEFAFDYGSKVVHAPAGWTLEVRE